jgi:hypothetical protein
MNRARHDKKSIMVFSRSSLSPGAGRRQKASYAPTTHIRPRWSGPTQVRLRCLGNQLGKAYAGSEFNCAEIEHAVTLR